MNKTRKAIRTGLISVLVLTAAVFAGALTGCDFEVNAPSDNSSVIVVTPPGEKTSEPSDNTGAPSATSDALQTQTPSGTPSVTAVSETEKPAVTDNPETGLPLSGVRVCVDPGHQDTGMSEKEPCAPWGPEANSSINNTVMKAKATAGTTGISTKKPEYAVNLEIALKLRDALEAKGATVIMSRTDNSSRISNMDRAIMANDNNCSVTFNIHCNGSDNQSVSGIELFVRGSGDNTSEYAARSKNDYNLGLKLLDKLSAFTGARKRNVNRSDSYTGINWRDHTTFIIECGFMSNPEEDSNLSDPDYQDKIVKAIVGFMIEDFAG